MCCTLCDSVHEYHMTGRVSEESLDAFNGTLTGVKKPLMNMPSITDQVQVVTVRGQANLKGSLLNERLTIMARIKGRKRGPQAIRIGSLDKARINIGELRIVLFKGERYCELQSGALLPEVWQDIYK